MSDHPICHVEIPAIDPAAASRFYAEVFGWQMEVDPTRNYHMFEPQHGPGGAFAQVGETTGARIGTGVDTGRSSCSADYWEVFGSREDESP